MDAHWMGVSRPAHAPAAMSTPPVETRDAASLVVSSRDRMTASGMSAPSSWAMSWLVVATKQGLSAAAITFAVSTEVDHQEL